MVIVWSEVDPNSGKFCIFSSFLVIGNTSEKKIDNVMSVDVATYSNTQASPAQNASYLRPPDTCKGAEKIGDTFFSSIDTGKWLSVPIRAHVI